MYMMLVLGSCAPYQMTGEEAMATSSMTEIPTGSHTCEWRRGFLRYL